MGIITHPAHQRRGVAAAVAAAIVEQCLSQGFSAVGWHCNADNVGSWKTAGKVGFEQNSEYAYHYYYHLVASACAHLRNREKALDYLLAAIDHGWTNVKRTKQQKEFSILHGTPEWNAVLARMNQDVAER